MMKFVKFGLVFSLVIALFACGTQKVRKGPQMMSIQDALNTNQAKEKLNPDIGLYFGDQATPGVITKFGDFMTNKKSNAFNKSDKEVCEWAFLSAMLALQDRALREGGNAVINIRSFYKRHLVSSKTEYECEAGAIIAGVTFKGEAVKLAK